MTMRLTLTILGLIIFNYSFGQLNLTNDEREILKDICSQYSQPNKEKYLKQLRKQTPTKFHNFIDQLIASKDDSDEVLKIKYLQRPTDEELTYWYVVRESHYNNSEPDSLKKTNDQILDWLTKEKIDDRWLLDNYYYRLSNRIGMLFNTADLSKHDFKLETLRLKNETERAMFVMFIINTCGQRLSVMKFTGKGDPESVIKRLPKINGKDYYYYKDFNYEDFEWIGYKKIESYNQRQMGTFYGVLINHLDLLLKGGQTEKAKELYRESILSNPTLFKYSASQKTLNDIYDKWK
jgi:hypothetical protein